MYVITLAAKLALALTLIAAGSAKLADIGNFASTVRLFIPPPPFASQRLRRKASVPAARLVVACELLTGYASLALPRAGWLNWVVLAFGAGFIAVSAVGYARYRNRACNCFGGLSRRRFNAAGVARSVVIAAIAGIATLPVPASAVTLSPGQLALLLIVAVLAGGATFTAAKAVAAVYRAQPRT